MSKVLSFVQQNGAGVGTLTVYTAALLYYFVVLPSTFPLANLVILGAVAPALIVYEVTEEFTDLIIKNLLEQHVAIARMKLELRNDGDFEEWNSGENVERIDELDRNSRQELTTAICALMIGVSAPFAGWFSLGIKGLAAGLVCAFLSVFVVLYALQQVVQTIERTPKVVQT